MKFPQMLYAFPQKNSFIKRIGRFETSKKNILQTTAKTTDQVIENVKKYAKSKNIFLSRQFYNSERQDELDGLSPVILIGIIGALAFFGKSKKFRNYKRVLMFPSNIIVIKKNYILSGLY